MEAVENYNNEVTDDYNDDFELVTLFKELNLDDQTTSNNGDIKVVASTVKTNNSKDDNNDDDDNENEKQSIVIELSSTAQRFRALGKIIHFMRKHFLSGNGADPLTIEQILEKTKQAEISADIKKWLETEALPNNKRIIVDGIYYQFKPTFQLKDAHDLVKLLKEQDRKGLGGVLMEDIRDSLPNYREVLKDCKANIFIIKRSLDRKRIVYYVDPNANQMSDFEIQAMWRSLGLEDIIEEEVNEPYDDNKEFCC